MGDLLDPFDIDAIALATKRENFRKDDIIVKESERGEILYMIENGVVNVFKKGSGETPIVTLSEGSFFGEKALFDDHVRQETYVAKSDVTVLYLVRNDFVRLLGDNMDKLLNKVVHSKKIVEDNLSSNAGTQHLFNKIHK